MQSKNISGPQANPFDRLKSKIGEHTLYKLPLLGD
jgi:hypothetical protein